MKDKRFNNNGFPEKNYIGKVFGDLSILRRAPNSPTSNGLQFVCSCVCGNQCIVSKRHLIKLKNPKRSCGGALGKHIDPHLP